MEGARTGPDIAVNVPVDPGEDLHWAVNVDDRDDDRDYSLSTLRLDSRLGSALLS